MYLYKCRDRRETVEIENILIELERERVGGWRGCRDGRERDTRYSLKHAAP